jgi:hypothetical protein
MNKRELLFGDNLCLSPRRQAALRTRRLHWRSHCLVGRRAGTGRGRGRSRLGPRSILHARFLDDQNEDSHELALFECSTQLYRRLGDAGEGESSFWVGCFHQVVRRDNDNTAVPALERAHKLARQTLERARELAQEVEGRVLHGLSPAERSQLVTLLRKAFAAAPPQPPWSFEEGD